MKGTARALFGVATRHRLVTEHDTHNRGAMLITGAVTLVKWPVTLVTCSYMYIRTKGSEATEQDAVERVGDKVVRCVVHRHLSHVFPISYVVDMLLDRVLSEQVRGRALENSLSVSRSAFILQFP